uniref:Uncharacterized protein n=1 Tax=Panagrolaimus davidi TaxID=227884 RepID=A0A914QG99_9BILA
MGQIPSNPTCPNINLEMTPNLRQKILDAMNTARKTVKNGQMQFYNGQYALPAAEMPNLIWSCAKEVELHHYLKSACDANPEPHGPIPDISWNHFGIDVADYVAFIENGFSQSNGTFGMSSSLFMARSPIFTGTQRLDIYYANAQTMGCAMYDCDIGKKAGNEGIGNFSTQVVCSVDPKVQFGEELYEVSSSATNYIPPSQDVICQDSIFGIELREMVMAKINEIRSKIQDGSYELENGEIALRASNLNNLAWSCDEEAEIGSAISSLSCDDTLYNPATEFQKILRQTTLWIYPDDIKGFVNQLINEFFVSNPNFNFLSSSTTYSIEYPAAFALSDKATTFAFYV